MPILPLILGQWIVKLVIALIDTPIVYGIVWFIRKDSGDNVVQEVTNKI